ncbi:MAG: energy transducer TonB [Pseudomonadota bacterium]|jgi:periplasmic protein TonB|nr:energy transducer TonB [Pseudomonadota bacterium]
MSEIVLNTRPTTQLPQLLRLVGGAAIALIVTFLLYWLMATLVAAGREAMTEGPSGRIVDFVRVKKDQDLNVDQKKPEKPQKPQAAPDTPQPQQNDNQNPDANTVNIGPMNVANDVSLQNGFGLSASDGEYLPIVKVAPIYPDSAARRGLEGWVLLKFTVTETGAVRDPVVLESEPGTTFDRAAMKAVLKFKYKPRVEGGKPVEVPGVEHLITFKLEK